MDKVGLESIITIFKAEKGMLQVLLFQEKGSKELEKWLIPNRIMSELETLEECSKKLLEQYVDYTELYLRQGTVFSDISRIDNKRVVGVSYFILTNSITEKLKFHIDSNYLYKWFPIDDIPFMINDHKNILTTTIQNLQKEVYNIDAFLALYPDEFTLPEVQKMLENLLKITIDRRNFRKKLINKNWIKETGKMSEPGNGRPGKLYTFNKNIKEESFC